MCVLHRASIEARVAKEKGIHLIFLESLCDDPAVIAANVALKVSSGDPDYKDMSPEIAKRDFLRRITEYEKVYETITEPHLSYLQIVKRREPSNCVADTWILAESHRLLSDEFASEA